MMENQEKKAGLTTASDPEKLERGLNTTSSSEAGVGVDGERNLDHPDDVAEGPANIFSEGGKTFRTMGRWDTAFVLITNQVGLGILSLPGILRTLGLVPGIIAILGFGALATYTAYVLLQFYLRHPHVVNIVDMCRVMGGKTAETVAAICLLVQLILICASTTVTISIAFNTLSSHAMCPVGFIGISALACWVLCLPRTVQFIAHVGIPATLSILIAIFIVMISLGIADPKQAPPGWEKEILVAGNPTFKEGLNACINVALAFAGNAGFVSFMAEMKDPGRDFIPALFALQAFSIPIYLVVAITIYCLAGQYTASPALGSAPEIPAKVAYGVVLLCLLSTGLVYGHTAIKFLYVSIMRALKATDELTKNTVRPWAVWIGSATIFWLLAFVIANAIPIFDSILNIASSTFVAWFTFGLNAILWLFMNKHQLLLNWKKTSLTVLNVAVVAMTLFMNGAGLWAGITTLIDIFNDADGGITGAFTCSDNSIF